MNLLKVFSYFTFSEFSEFSDFERQFSRFYELILENGAESMFGDCAQSLSPSLCIMSQIILECTH